MLDSMPMGICVDCGHLGPAGDFVGARGGQTQYCASCRTMHSAADKAWRDSPSGKAWAVDNRSRKAAATSAWRNANPERKSATDKAWIASPSGKAYVSTRNAKNRAIGRPIAGDRYTAAFVAYLLASPCAYCGRHGKTEASGDHVTPISRGGHPTCPSNIVPVCRPCNRGMGGKHAKDKETWIVQRFGWQNAIKISKRVQLLQESQAARFGRQATIAAAA